jgi:gamma-glutamylcysteine synthetase
VGLLYDEESLQGALDIIGDWTIRERAMLRRKVPQQGLKVPFRDGLLKHVAQDVYKLAKVCSTLVVLHYFQFEGFDFMRLMFIPATAL